MPEKKTILFEEKFSEANLWLIKDPAEPTAEITLKKDIFRWMRDWGFADSQAKNPKDYLYGMTCLIEDQSAAGLRLDPEKSQGDRLVAMPIVATSYTPISREEAEKLAKKVLGIETK